MGSIFELIFTGVGGFICWTLTGSKGSIKLELSKPYDRDFRYYRNYFVGISFLLFVIFVFYGLFKQRSHAMQKISQGHQKQNLKQSHLIRIELSNHPTPLTSTFNEILCPLELKLRKFCQPFLEMIALLYVEFKKNTTFLKTYQPNENKYSPLAFDQLHFQLCPKGTN